MFYNFTLRIGFIINGYIYIYIYIAHIFKLFFKKKANNLMVKFLFDKQNIKVQFFFSLKVYNNNFKK